MEVAELYDYGMAAAMQEKMGWSSRNSSELPFWTALYREIAILFYRIGPGARPNCQRELTDRDIREAADKIIVYCCSAGCDGNTTHFDDDEKGPKIDDETMERLRRGNSEAIPARGWFEEFYPGLLPRIIFGPPD